MGVVVVVKKKKFDRLVVENLGFVEALLTLNQGGLRSDLQVWVQHHASIFGNTVSPEWHVRTSPTSSQVSPAFLSFPIQVDYAPTTYLSMPMTQQIKTEVGLPHRQRDFNRLIAVFLAWKSLLILLAVLTPGPGYDTSGFIVLAENEQSRSQIHPPSISDRLALSHLRWDALYFVKAAQRGYLYEQEWAFSRAHSWTLGTVKDCRLSYTFSYRVLTL
jgi:hypothetical protein